MIWGKQSRIGVGNTAFILPLFRRLHSENDSKTTPNNKYILSQQYDQESTRMTRISAEAISSAIQQNPDLRFAIVGHSKSGPGRVSVLLRVPATLQARMDRLAVGPSYLLYIRAMEEFLKRLEAMPKGDIQIVDAETFNPTQADLTLAEQLEAAKPPRATRKP